VRPLFQGGQDDNLANTYDEDDDNLWKLHEWDSTTKAKKLSKILDRKAKNLLSQMLTKDPKQRPSMSRILAHPFLSMKSVTRLQGDEAQFDVFISYRVASDSEHVELLYNALTAKGIKVWWDKMCLPLGKDWEKGFCDGLVNSRTFVCLLSRGAINHSEKEWQNFSCLREDSKCDNVMLEHRFALELAAMGMIECIFPVMIGDYDGLNDNYGNFFSNGCKPNPPNVTVQSIETVLLHHMDDQGLGTPMEENKTAASVFNDILKCQGAFVMGKKSVAFDTAVEKIVQMIEELKADQLHTSRKDSAPTSRPNTRQGPANDLNDLLVEKNNEIRALQNEIESLQSRLQELQSSSASTIDVKQTNSATEGSKSNTKFSKLFHWS
jgi:serine/threonine protein kinase